MKKLMFTLAAASLAGLVQADWKKTAGGTYDYNDPANWDENGINGVFPATLTLEGAQTITFSADTSLPGGLTIAYAGNHPMTFKSADDTTKTLTLKGGLSATMAGSADAKVTFDESLEIDLGADSRTITAGASNAELAIKSAIKNGSVVVEGEKKLRLAGANTYAGGTTINGATYVYVSSPTAFGSGTVTVNGDMSFCSDAALTMTANNKFILNCANFYGRANKNCALDLGTGDVIVPALVKHWAEGEGGIVLHGNIKVSNETDARCKPTQIEKWGSRTLTLYSNWEAAGETFTIANGTLNFYGSISGENPKISGTSNSTPFNMYGANTFAGTLEVSGGNVTVYTRNDAAIPDGAKAKVMLPAVLAAVFPKAIELLSWRRIAADSTGTLALYNNETADFDLSGTPWLRLGAAGSTRTIMGTITPSTDGVWRLGGGGKSLLLGSENALTGKGRLEVYGNNVVLQKSNDFVGEVIINPGNCLEVKDDAGALANATVHVYGGIFSINSTGKSGCRRAGTVHLHGGVFQYAGNKNNATVDAVDKLVLDVRDPLFGVVGGVCHLKLYANGKTAEIQVGKLERRNDMIFRIGGNADGNKLKVGGEAGTNTTRLTVGNADEILASLVGGGGDPNTPTVSIYPFAFIDNGTYHDSLVTYGANGFRGLNIDTEYATSITPGTVSQANVRLPVGTETTLDAATTVNSVFLQGSDPNKGATTIKGEGKLTVSSGVVVEGYHRNNSPHVDCPVDFGSHQGVVCFARGKVSYWSGAVHGTSGVIFFQASDSAVLGHEGTGLQVSGDAVKASTLTGDVVIHGRVDASVHNLVPGGAARPGDIVANGYANIAGGDFNAINGIGYFYRDDNTMSIGQDGSDGNLEGAFFGTSTIEKFGTGRQRIAGESTHTGATTVEAGILQNDGAFTASAVTVKTGATLAGSGSFAKIVTLEDGAKLEAGSLKSDDDQVMNLNGGLTLKGAATLDLVATDRVTVGGVAVKGAFTIPTDKVVTVNVLLAKDAQGKDLKLKGPAQHVVFAAESPLTLANFKRGTNCGPLTLSQDGTQLLMTVQNGFTIAIR